MCTCAVDATYWRLQTPSAYVDYLLPTLSDPKKGTLASHTETTSRSGIPAKGVAVDDLTPFESTPHRTNRSCLRKADLRQYRQYEKEDDKIFLHYSKRH